MEHNTISIAEDPTMPVGRCVVVRIADNAIIYKGGIAGLVDEALDRDGLVVILHPTDFADYMICMKKMMSN